MLTWNSHLLARQWDTCRDSRRHPQCLLMPSIRNNISRETFTVGSENVVVSAFLIFFLQKLFNITLTFWPHDIIDILRHHIIYFYWVTVTARVSPGLQIKFYFYVKELRDSTVATGIWSLIIFLDFWDSRVEEHSKVEVCLLNPFGVGHVLDSMAGALVPTQNLLR